MFFTKRELQPIKKWHLVLLAVIIIAAIVFRFYYNQWPKATVIFANKEVKVLVANTYARRVEGWSGKKDMGKYGGMLFIFDKSEQHTMVMRDMLFPLDIVWINKGKIVDMAPNLQPEAGRLEAELTRFSARAPSTWVVELPVGFILQNNLKVGDKVIVK